MKIVVETKIVKGSEESYLKAELDYSHDFSEYTAKVAVCSTEELGQKVYKFLNHSQKLEATFIESGYTVTVVVQV